MDADPQRWGDDEPEVVVEHTSVTPGHLMFTHLPYEAGPQFRIGEVCKVFFARTDHWFRWLQRVEPETETRLGKENYLLWRGREVGVRKNEKGTRVFGVRDVEEVAYALADNGRIDGEELRNILVLLDTIGRIHNVRWPKAEEDS